MTPLEALKEIGKLKENECYINTTVEYKIVENALKENQERIEELEETNHLMYLRHHKDEKKLKAFEIIKENLTFAIDESESGKPCLTMGVKVNKNHIVIIYQTFDKEKIDLLKEVLL